MNVADHYRSTLDELTREQQVGLDLSAVMAAGRRRRRVRRASLVGAGVAVAAVAVVAGVSLAGGSSPRAVDPGPGDHPSYHDFVPGTDVDETLQATVARHLPDAPPASTVFPSDWNTSGPIPARDFANATEWHAVYDLAGTERLSLLMSEPVPGQPADLRCDLVEQADIPCRRVELPDGSVETRSGYLLGTSTYRFMTVRVAADGFVIETLDDVRASSVDQARAARTFTDATATPLVRDPALTFPAPTHTPPSPSPQS